MMAMPSSIEMRAVRARTAKAAAMAPAADRAISTDWRNQLPILAGDVVTLRDLTISDAPSLHALLTAEEVARFISPPPTTVEGFERFIEWTHRERRAGRYVCFAVVPRGTNIPIGLFQVRTLDGSFTTAEWGFAFGSAYWGTGMFVDGAQAVIDFVCQSLGVRRLEARVAVENGRGQGALRKLGAVQEATLRQSFLRRGEHLDQALWCIYSDEWWLRRIERTQLVH